MFNIRPNDGNAYGLHMRVRHRVGETNGHEYRTIYAHLSQVLVSEGQRVSAGERIALAGNTGHSFGPHLHLTLKLLGAKTPGYPDGVVDPLPYLQEVEVAAPSDLTVYTTDRVRLRAKPTITSAQMYTWASTKESSVSTTPPPTLFSIGTIPNSQWPPATSWNTARMSASG